MKRKQAPARRSPRVAPARRSPRVALKSGVGVEQQSFCPTSLSFSGSCSSPVPSQRTMGSKLKFKQQSQSEDANTAKHLWKHHEEVKFLEFAAELQKTLPYHKNKSEFHRELAKLMNDYFAKPYNKFVRLDASKVRTKIVQHEESWLAQSTTEPKKMFSSSGHSLDDHNAVFNALFSVDEATSTPARSVSRKRTSTGAVKSTSTGDLMDIVPENVQSAVEYLSACGSAGPELYLLTAILMTDRVALTAFLGMKTKTYEERRDYLIMLWKKRLVSVDIDQTKLPKDLQRC